MNWKIELTPCLSQHSTMQLLSAHSSVYIATVQYDTQNFSDLSDARAIIVHYVHLPFLNRTNFILGYGWFGLCQYVLRLLNSPLWAHEFHFHM